MVNILDAVNDRMVVMLSGEIDHHTAALIRPAIDDAIDTKKPGTLVLDFSGVSFMDSSGIGLVMGRYRLISSYNGTVEVANVPKNFKRVMKMAGLYKLAKFDEGGFENETN